MSLRERLLQPEGLLRGALFRDLLRSRLGDQALQAGDRVGAWRIVRELGRGGMGLVYLAERGHGHGTLLWQGPLPEAERRTA